MKKIILKFSVAGIIAIFCIFYNPYTSMAQEVTVSYQSFYDNLSPYGQWIYEPQYGNVFVPYEDASFRPYTRGHWVMTEYGNTWVSDDPWGWACYHYGRWTYNSYYGWMWIPGNEWAPAWVSWRYGNGYAGWAPLGPDYVLGQSYYCDETWWVFVEPTYMYHPRWREYQYEAHRNRVWLRRTEIADNYEGGGRYGHYNYGPRAERIERDTHQPVVVYRTTNEVRPVANAMNEHSVNIYRPGIEKNSIHEAHPVNVINAPRPIGNVESYSKRDAGVHQFHQEHPSTAPNNNTNPVRSGNWDNGGNKNTFQQEPVHYTPTQNRGGVTEQQTNPDRGNHRGEPVEIHQNIPEYNQPRQQQVQPEPRRETPEPPRYQPQQQQHQPEPVRTAPTELPRNYNEQRQPPEQHSNNQQNNPNRNQPQRQNAQTPKSQQNNQPHKEEKKKK